MEDIKWQDYITSNEKILYGKPVIKGTRIPVDLILEKLSKGETMEQLLEAYPNLVKEAIYACLSFASKSVRNEIILDEAK